MRSLSPRPAAPVARRPQHTFQPTTLRLREGLSYKAWERVGRDVLQPITRGTQWWIGDWLLYGEQRFGEKYAQAIDATGYEAGTLANMNWVSAAIAPSRRRENLSWGHHQVIAPLPPVDQERWLVLAEREGLSVSDLRRRVKEAKGAPALASPNSARRCSVCGQPLVCLQCQPQVATA